MEIDRISKLIKKLRKEKNLTQEELGNLLGVSGKAVSKWERGESLPDVTIIKKLSDNLGISSDELLQGKVIQNRNDNKNKNKKSKYLLILLVFVFLVISLLIIFNHKKEENDIKENNEDTCTLIRTFYIDDIKNSNDENYLYVTLHEYQVEGIFTIKISKVIGKDLEKNNNYEFTFTTPKDYIWESTDTLFNNRKVISIEQTDKVGTEQISKYYC